MLFIVILSFTYSISFYGKIRKIIPELSSGISLTRNPQFL